MITPKIAYAILLKRKKRQKYTPKFYVFVSPYKEPYFILNSFAPNLSLFLHNSNQTIIGNTMSTTSSIIEIIDDPISPLIAKLN